MFFLFWLGSDIKERVVGEGSFLCPRCRSTQACDVIRAERRLKLYSVLPVWWTALGELRRCRACGATDREPAPPPDTWACARCGNVNPAGVPACVRCGAPR